jgi:acetoin utilization protein AcuB
MRGLTVKSIEVAYTDSLRAISTSSPLLLALNMLISSSGIYRLTVVDSARQVRGVLSGLRLLEVLFGIKAEGIKKRAGGGTEPLLGEPVHLFISGYLHKLSYDIPVRGLVSYIVENKVGHVVLVDQMNTLKGVVTEGSILGRVPPASFTGKVSDVMKTPARTIGPEDTLLDAAKTMSSHGIRRLPVVDGKKLLGMLTATSMLKHISAAEYHIRAVLTREDLTRFLVDTVARIKLEKVPVLTPETNLHEVAQRIVKPQSNAFPVVDSADNVIGIVTPRDVLVSLPRQAGLDAFVELLKKHKRSIH